MSTRLKPWHAALLIGLVLMALACYKANRQGFTHDESFSYNHYLDDSVMEVVSYNARPLLPNNHIVNTLWLQLADSIFGPQEFFLRGLSLLMLPLMLLAYWWALGQLRQPWLRLPLFVLLSGNAYVFEYFTLARGYAEGIGFLMAGLALYMAHLAVADQRKRWAALALLGLGSIAQFTVLNVFAVVVVYDVLVTLSTKDPRNLWQRLAAPFITSIALGCVLYEPLRLTLEAQQLFGGRESFIVSVVQTVAHGSIINIPNNHEYGKVLVPTVVALAAVGFFLLAIRAYRLGPTAALNQPFVFVAALLFGNVAVVFIQVYLLEGYFPEARTALYFVPIYMLMVADLVDELATWKPMVGGTVSLALAGLAVIIFVQMYRPHHTIEWHYDRHTAQLMLDIDKAVPEKLKSGQINMSSVFFFEPTLNFYRVKYGLTYLRPIERLDSVSQHICLSLIDTKIYHRFWDGKDHELARFDYLNLKLMRNNCPR